MFYFPKCPDRLFGLTNVLFSRYRGYYPEVKQPVREINDSPRSSVEVKNEWSRTFTPPIRISGMERENITITFFYHPGR